MTMPPTTIVSPVPPRGAAAPRFLPTAATGAVMAVALAAALVAGCLPVGVARAAPLWAGVAKVEITDREAKPVNDPLYVKVLALRDDATTVVLATVDAVSLGEIGRIRNDYLPNVRARLQKELRIDPAHVVVNASHCHGLVCVDIERRTVQAVAAALRSMTPVRVGVGVGRESRIMENRRLLLKSGGEADVRHAYSLPPDEDVVGVGPVDPQIGVLRLDRTDGRTLAVVYNFACHPIQGVPSGGNTADIVGFASKAVEESLGAGATALFLQGCAGDVNPVRYKEVNVPRDAEPLGNMLGLSVLRAVRQIKTRENAGLKIVREIVALPRGADLPQRIAALQAEQARVLKSLRGTSLNLKTFVPLYVKYRVSGEFPSYYSHRYLHEKTAGSEDLKKLDADNRSNMDQYVQNIYAMEQLTRLQENLDLLKMHHAQNVAAGKPTIDAEVVGLRVGDFVLVTFPGEPSVEIGLNIKKRSPNPFTFVAGYTNGYLYYAPTEKQRNNPGCAQEDCDCLLAPQWQKIYEEKVQALLKRL